MTGAGVFYGNLVFGSQDNTSDRVVDDGKLLPYPEFHGPSKDAYGKPLALVLSEFHFLILNPGRLSAVNRLSEEIVYEETFDASQSGTMLGMVPDPRKGTVWMFSDRMVFEVEIEKEQRDIWRLYLEKSEYANALAYCETQAQKEHAHNAQADFYFNEGSYELAATSYAKTQRSFEEITLKFLGISHPNKQGRNALQKYLLSKLDNLAPADLTQTTMICTWLTEIFLDNLNVLQPEPAVTIHTTNEQKVSQTAKNYNDYEEQLREFKEFLGNFSDCLNRDTTFALISSHGRIEELLYYAELAGELEWLISHHIQQGQFQLALSFLEKHESPGKCVNLYYKFCPTLMHNIPRETTDMLIKLTPPLDPAKLIPTLMRYKEDPTASNHAIRYLEYAINTNECKDPPVHNYLVSLYAKQQDEGPLLRFIDKYKTGPIYDYKYALRLCHDEGKSRACVGIYTAMGQYQEAVRLGLEVAPNLAKKVVEQSQGDEEEKRRLWLIIAKYIIQTGNDMKAAMALIKDCNLKLEDILPYFPDFARIGDFKDEICASLESYNKTIESLKSEMGQYTTSAERIREDTHELRSRSGFVTANQKCDLCAQPVLVKQFFLFPCTHVFHVDCASNHVRRFLDGRRERQSILEQVEIGLRAGELKALDQGAPNDVDPETRLIEVYASSQCVFCGEIMIEEVREAFIQPHEQDEVRSWEI